jgi:hypothetical protein
MLAMADARGYVAASLPGIASRARVPLASAEAAVAKFMAPDAHSRTPDNDGRRVAKADRGWLLLNYAKFRDLRSSESRRASNREAARRLRAKKKAEREMLTHADANDDARKPENVTADDADVIARHRASSTIITSSSRVIGENADGLQVGDSADEKLWKTDDASSEIIGRHQKSAQAEAEADKEKRDRAPAARDAVFEHWLAVMGLDATRTKLNAKRREKLRARRREGYTDEQLCQAIDGCKLSDFHMGKNDRGQKYNCLATILRDGSTVEAHAARAAGKAAGPRITTAQTRVNW